MANVRCPMCSKFNPPEAEACAYCGARLKPIYPSSSGQPDQPKSGSPVSGVPAGDEPDWLRGLRADETGDAAADDTSADEEIAGADMPDWLSRIRDRNQTDADMPQAEDETSSVPDWMSSLSSITANPSEESSLPNSNAELPTSSSQSEEDNLDWLGGLNFNAEPTTPTPSEEESPRLFTPGSFGLTDFLREQSERLSGLTPDSPDTTSSSADDMPSNELPGSEGNDFFSEQSWGSEEQGLDLPPWGELSSNQAGSDQSTGLPSWMTPGEESPAGAEAGGADFPNWLNSLQSPEGEKPAEPGDFGPSGDFTWPEETQAASQPTAGSEPDFGLPDWLNASSGSAAEQPAEDSPASQEASDLGLPGWLGSGGSDEPPLPPEEGTAEASDEEGIPGWMVGAGALAAAAGLSDKDISTESSSTAEFRSQIPAWMSMFDSSDTGQGAEPPVEGDEYNAEEPTASAGGEKEPFIDENTPDWLRDFNAGADDTDESVVPLIGMDEPPAAMEGADSGQPFAVDLPDWLDEESAAEPAVLEASAAEAPADELTQAELPEWVKDMRPIEAAVISGALLSEVDQRVEKAGPLAGLRGVLPTEDLATYYRKPPTYSAKLRVTEKQRGQATLLESIISQESQPLLVPKKQAKKAQIIPRILIALLILTALIIPRLLDLQPLGIPVLYPTEMLNMFEQIDQLQGETSTILLAIDYEPGRAGEMKFTASPVIEQLMERGVNLVVVSTNPNGPPLAQELLEFSAETNEERTQQAYNLEGQTVNLGYLPGGAVSLLEFSMYPRRSAPSDLSGNEAVWNETFLQNINTLADFTQIIVLTDSTEAGRAWVEQIQPVMGDVPLFMVASAQASPLLLPYLESGQIAGLVSGVLGGAMYARLVSQGSGPVQTYLATYQVGILLGFGLILVGALVSGNVAIFKRNDKDEA